MENVEEGGNGIASRLSNLRLLDEGVVEDGGSALLLLVGIAAGIFALGLFSRRHTRHVEAHLDELVLASSCLLALAASAA